MKEILKSVAEVTNVTYDTEHDCYIAELNTTIPVPVWTGSGVEYANRNSIYLEFGTIDLSKIRAGDTITIISYEHLCGESTKFYGIENFTFSSDGYHNVITSVIKAYNTNTGKILHHLNYKDSVVNRFDSLVSFLYMIPISERRELLTVLMWQFTFQCNKEDLEKIQNIYAELNK